MPLDGDKEHQSSIPESSKPKTENGVKRQVDQEHKTFPEKLHGLKTRIESIFNKRDLTDQSPRTILQELSILEVPQNRPAETTVGQEVKNDLPPLTDPDLQTKIPTESSSLIPDTTLQDQAEIDKITQAIQNLEAEQALQSVETTPETPPPQLFSDRPTLYEQHYKKYRQEKRTIGGALQRHSDINQLKKAGIKDAAKIYDSLRSRGVYASSIIHEATRENRWMDFDAPPTSEEKNDLFKKAPEIIERLHSIGQDTSWLDINKTDKAITTLNNQEFQQKRRQIQSLFFLDSNTAIRFLSTSNPNPNIDAFIDYLNSNFINNQNSEESFEPVKYPISQIINFYSHSNYDYNRFLYDFTKLAVTSKLNPDSPITIPETLFLPDTYITTDRQVISSLNDLDQRQYQRFLLENPKSIEQTLFKDKTPTIKFYQEFLFSETNQDRKITIPQATLDLIEDPKQRTFYQNVSALENPDLQKICFRSARLNVLNYFNKTGEPNLYLLANYLIDNGDSIISGAKSDISPEHLLKLPPKDQKKIKVIRHASQLNSQLGLDPQSIYRKLLSKNNGSIDDFDKYYNQNNQPNFSFFKDILEIDANEEQTAHLINLIREKTNTFSDKEKKLLTNIFSLKELPPGLIKFIIHLNDISTQTNPIFNESGQPTTVMFQHLLSNNKFFKYDFFTSNLTPEILDSFSPEDRKFWKCLTGFKTLNQEIASNIRLTIIYEGDNADKLFTQNNQAKSYLFEILTKGGQFQSDFFTSNLTPEILDSFSPEDRKFWNHLIGLKNLDSQTAKSIVLSSTNPDILFTQDGQPKSYLFKALAKDRLFQSDFFTSNLTPEVIASFSPEDQKFWNHLIGLKNLDSQTAKSIVSSDANIDDLFTQDNQPKSYLFEILAKDKLFQSDFFTSNLTPEILDSFSPEDRKFWNHLIQSGYLNNQDLMSLLFSENKSQFIKNGELTTTFYQQLALKYPSNFISTQDKNVWKILCGDDLMSELLNSLPTLSDEKRNAFTHNSYDRTSDFFKFLTEYSSLTKFKLDIEHIKIASEYIKTYGLAKNFEFYNYFQSLYLYQQKKLDTLPSELIDNHITSIEDLSNNIKAVQKVCFATEPMLNLYDLTPFELNLISIITGHNRNRFHRTQFETIVSDFSRDLNLIPNQIAPLPPEFHPETFALSSINIQTDKKISDSPKLTLLSQEILSATKSHNNIYTEKATVSELFRQRIKLLSDKIQQGNPGETKKQESIQQQIDALKQNLDEISNTQTIDELLDKLIVFNLNLGKKDEDKFNSTLRQLVFKQVFNKHQNSPGWQEAIAASLENDSETVSSVNHLLNLINNTIKDHVLNFEAQNQDGYWSKDTFKHLQQYSSHFKKKLDFPAFISELQSYQESFHTTNLYQDQTIQIIPDRGLMGELSGYIADVCYTKVYPLLEQYPDMVPYKFITNPESDAPEFIGSTLVFKTQDVDDNPVFLIRAFNVPNEHSIDMGKFFELFVDHLTPIAKTMGVKKIIAAGIPGTISNYNIISNYVLSKYVTDKTPTTLKDTFNFNGYDITNNCYQIRDLSEQPIHSDSV